MTTKTIETHIKFLTASPRVTDTCRIVAHQSKYLAACSEFEDLAHLHRPHHGRMDDYDVIVLSHVDDDYLVLKSPLVEPVLDTAFHVLFTEDTTHPEQVANWIRGTRIQSENRLHVAKVDKFEPPRVSEVLNRYCHALGDDTKRGGIIDAFLMGDTLFVRGHKHRVLHVPVHMIGSLRGKPRNLVQEFRIDPDGSFVYWPALDVHLGWNQFLQVVDPAAHQKALQRSGRFNTRYGAAIRKLREEAGIPQSKVSGLTDRQVRRIELGESRATTGALAALAKAHGLSVNEYMDRVAKAMK
jgi:hypothetical protein